MWVGLIQSVGGLESKTEVPRKEGRKKEIKEKKEYTRAPALKELSD